VALPARASDVNMKTFIIWAAIAKLLRWSFLAIVVLGLYDLWSVGKDQEKPCVSAYWRYHS
jgi:hypothetical protein